MHAYQIDCKMLEMDYSLVYVEEAIRDPNTSPASILQICQVE